MLTRPHLSASALARKARHARAKQHAREAITASRAKDPPRTGGIAPRAMDVADAVIHELKVRAPGRVGWEYAALPRLHDGAGGIRSVAMISGADGTVLVAVTAAGELRCNGRAIDALGEAIAAVGGVLRHRTVAGR
jgi:hypothetical protein